MILLPALVLFYGTLDRPYTLMVGDPPPKLKVSKWLVGQPVHSFAKGHVYVLDFFATWCVPCKKAMPALSALQTQYKANVTFVGIDVCDYQDRVPAFLTEMGPKLNYRVALDDLPAIPKDEKNIPMWAVKNGPTSNDWLVASGRHEEGIPTVFVVDASGHVAWIGDDTDALAKQLPKIVNGSFDLQAAAKAYALQAAHDKPIRSMRDELFHARRANDWTLVVACCEKLMAVEPALGSYAATKFQVMLFRQNQRDQAYAFARQQLASTNPSFEAFSQMAMTIVDNKKSRGPEDLALATQLASHANDLAKGAQPGPLLACAEIAHLRGAKEAAVRFQKQAIAKMTDEADLKEAKKRLLELEALKA